jgi:hypothetical protein
MACLIFDALLNLRDKGTLIPFLNAAIKIKPNFGIALCIIWLALN